MKILVLGSNGMAGHLITLYLCERGHSVTTFSRHLSPFGNSIIGDAFNIQNLRRVLLSDNFDAVVNCIGILTGKADERPQDAVFINSYLPHYITSVLSDRVTKFIQLSTDCVFSGANAPYDEISIPDGTTFYDRTKALGEINDCKNLTFRNSIIGPDWNKNGIGLFNWFMNQSNCISGYTGAIWTGVTTLYLAKAIECAILQDLCGIYHLVNNSSISKFDLLRLFNQQFKDNSIVIKENFTFKLDKTLICTRNDFDFYIPSYEEMVVDMKLWVSEHKKLYPNYSLISSD